MLLSMILEFGFIGFCYTQGFNFQQEAQILFLTEIFSIDSIWKKLASLRS